jgi:hypothetical protein
MLGTGIHQKRIQATIASTTAQLGVEIAGDKSLTKKLLGDNGVPVPRGSVVADEEDAIDVASELGWPVVVKPLDASHGRGVLTNIRSEEELRLAYQRRAQVPRRRHRRELPGGSRLPLPRDRGAVHLRGAARARRTSSGTGSGRSRSSSRKSTAIRAAASGTRRS